MQFRKTSPRPRRRYVRSTPNRRHSGGDVRYRADFVRFTPESGPNGRMSRESESDPKRKWWPSIPGSRKASISSATSSVRMVLGGPGRQSKSSSNGHPGFMSRSA